MLRLVDKVAGCRGTRSAYSGDSVQASHRSHLGAASHLPYDPPAERHHGGMHACSVLRRMYPIEVTTFMLFCCELTSLLLHFLAEALARPTLGPGPLWVPLPPQE
ncbi:unnamed protein product [Gadus morhua 'NCC']